MNKKQKVAAIVVACVLLTCSVVALVVTAVASTADTLVVLTPYWKENFERFATNQPYVKQALYLNGANGIITAEKGKVITGERSLIVSGDEAENVVDIKYGTLNLIDGSYTLSMNVRPIKATSLTIAVRKNYLTENADSFLARKQLALTTNEAGTVTAIADNGIQVGKAEVKSEDGVVSLTIEFTKNNTDAFVYVAFGGEGETSMVIDDIVVYNHATSQKVAIKDIDENYNNADVNQSVFQTTHFWCNFGDMSWDINNFNNTNSVLYKGTYYNSNGDNIFIGGLTAEEWTTKGNTTYRYQVDIGLEDISTLVFTTLDNRGTGQTYSEITYSRGGWIVTAKGGITDFTAEKMNGFWRLSWNRLASDMGKDEHYMFATSGEGVEGKIWIDNFVVAHF